MIASTKKFGREKGCVGKTQQHIQRQTRPLVREGALQKQYRNCQIVIAKYLVMSPRWGSTPKLTDWLTDRQSQCDFDFDFDPSNGVPRATVTLRVVGGDEKGSLKSETAKYGREYQETRTRQRLRWQEPAAYTKDRPVLSSERAPHKKQNRNCQKIINIWWRARDGARYQDLLTDWPSVTM
jgi:hypothetical protein